MRISKIFQYIHFKWIVKRHDKFMFEYNFCAIRKNGVTDLQVYKVAMRCRKKKLYESMKYKIYLLELARR